MEYKLKNKDVLFFGIDELEFTFKNGELEENVFFEYEKNLDDDNSSYAYLYLDDFNIKFHYSKIYPKGYEYGLKFSTVVDGQIIDCFAMLKGRAGKVINSKDKIVFYSSFFVLEYLKKLSFTLSEFMLCFGDSQLHRLDIALDVPYDIETINKDFFSEVNFFAQIGRDKKNDLFSQTYYINNPRSDRNRKYIFRIYDKILDTVKKQKAFLYPHLINQSNVRRIELELRPEECKRIKNYNIDDILNNRQKSIANIFANYFNKHSKKIISHNNLKLSKYTNTPLDLRTIYLKTEQIPLDYMSRANGYITNIKNNTGYKGLFDVIIKNNEYNEKKFTELLTLYEELNIYIKQFGINKSLMKKILKKQNII